MRCGGNGEKNGTVLGEERTTRGTYYSNEMRVLVSSLAIPEGYWLIPDQCVIRVHGEICWDMLAIPFPGSRTLFGSSSAIAQSSGSRYLRKKSVGVSSGK